MSGQSWLWAFLLETTRHLLEREKLVVEPSGAATLAALMHGRVPTAREPIVAIISGGNADLTARAATPT